ncbi:hypothetical protein FN846DRAFT_250612 [Sphaerosporella brunnea]|uniref:Uncharacterized protein n=1 Tax=Sphaerosporella brunnea TaxID=1250544 RepID=A0A5J5FC87_9PEZI|nr:hypothetical protein FN846DRAFT_250612 [Sphaerosporella brunnea]
MPRGRGDKTVFKTKKAVAARFFQLRLQKAPTATYLHRTGRRVDDKCWWCNSGAVQTRGHPFKFCKRWKDAKRLLWRRVSEATKEGGRKRWPATATIAKEWVYWLRLVAAPLHYPFLFFAHALSRNTPNLYFRTLTYPPSSMDMKPWKEVVKTIYPDPEEHTVIIDDGVPHCEAVLACLHYLASSGESVDPSVVSQDVLDQLKTAAPRPRC